MRRVSEIPTRGPEQKRSRWPCGSTKWVESGTPSSRQELLHRARMVNHELSCYANLQWLMTGRSARGHCQRRALSCFRRCPMHPIAGGRQMDTTTDIADALDRDIAALKARAAD